MKLMIQWAVTSSVLLLLVVLVRGLFREKLSACVKYALWGIVLVRLLVPYQAELPGRISDAVPVLASNLAQDVTPWLDHTMLYAVPTKEQPDDKVPTGLPPEYRRNGFPNSGWEYYTGGLVYDGNQSIRYAFMMTALEVVVYTWIAGTALTVLVILIANLHFALRLRKRRRPLEGIDAPIPVYTAENLRSPCLFGAVWPAVYVTPEAAENPKYLRHVLAHELTHYAHKDHIWSALRCLALAVHWYNPLVWLAVALSKRDGELACDEGAIARLGEAERIAYGRTLVDMAAARSLSPADFLTCTTAMTGRNRKKFLQQRVAWLVRKPKTVRTALFTAAAMAALSVVFVFAERGQPDTTLPPIHHLDRMAEIYYAPPPYSSQIYPEPITDEDLLEEALEILYAAADLRNIPEDLDLSDAPFVSSRITLLEDSSTSGQTYLLYTDRADRRCYLVTPAGLTAEVYTPIAVLDSTAQGALEHLARQQQERRLDPSRPRPIPQDALDQYDAEFLRRAGITQLQGQPGGLEEVKFYAGCTTPDRIELWYRGDAVHNSGWVLALSRDGNTFLADQPMEVYNAARAAGEEPAYEQLGPGAFAAFLRPEDVTAAYAAQGGNRLGELSRQEIQALKEQLVEALYHQCAAVYEEEEYGQYTVTILVEKDVGHALQDGGPDGLVLSIGSEPDVVCLRHRILSSPNRHLTQYVRSPELYQALRARFP